ncbi:MAG: PspC domain-containing protein [Ferruginibacter sp.]
MKQVININFQGRVVPIEVTAFEILKKYTESLNRYFELEEGKDEIINDIESRIGELFQERLKEGSTCITDDDINAIIKSMGRPEDFETDQATVDAANNRRQSYQGPIPQSAPFQSAGAKRLFRDENSKVVGGVCSGLANYFGIDVVIVRIIFVILGISFGFGIISYLILWVAVPSTATTQIGSLRKKLYRDGDNKIIAGVCSGIGNYFGVNAWIPRVLFLLPFLSFITRWDDFDFVRVGFSPGSLIIYIILWLVIPEALTTAEKLEMKGEKVDMNSIKNSVMEEMKGVQQRAEKFGKEAGAMAQERGKTFGAEVGSVAKRGGRSLGDIIALLFKLFAYFILGCIGFAVVMALIAMGIFAVGVFPMKDFVLTEGWQSAMAWGTLIFFIAVPIIGILTWLIRRLARIKSNRKTMRFTFAGLWMVGWICFISLIVSVGRDFRSTNNPEEQEVALLNPGINRLEITSNSPDKKFYRTRWFRMEPFQGVYEDTALIQNVSIHIVKSPTDSFRVTMIKMANGRNRRYADTLANMIEFNATQMDSLLVIDKGIPVTRKDKFRNQRIVLTVYVPVGKQIRVDRSVGWGQNISFGFNSRDWDIDFDDVEEGWDQNVDYIMKADGLYTLNGEPADKWKHNQDDGGMRMNVEDGDTQVRIDEHGLNVTDGRGDTYRYDRSKPLSNGDSLKMEMDKRQQHLKDSLQKVKDTIDKQLRKLNTGIIESASPTAYTLPAYNPMLLMN